jgi:6-phosphofructokinase 1
LGGIGDLVAAEVRRTCQVDVRAMVLGHLQRGGSPTAFDRLLATRFGAIAVHMIAQDHLGHMAAFRNGRMTAIPMSDAVSHQKQVPLDSDLVRTALGLNICLGTQRQALVAGQERNRR